MALFWGGVTLVNALICPLSILPTLFASRQPPAGNTELTVELHTLAVHLLPHNRQLYFFAKTLVLNQTLV